MVAYRLANWYVLLCPRVLLPTWCVFRQWMPNPRVHGGAMAQQPKQILPTCLLHRAVDVNDQQWPPS